MKVSKIKFEIECGVVYRITAAYHKGIDLLALINASNVILWAEIDGERFADERLTELLRSL